MHTTIIRHPANTVASAAFILAIAIAPHAHADDYVNYNGGTCPSSNADYQQNTDFKGEDLK